MDYLNVKQILALYSEDDVNEKLDNGWILLSVNAESDGTSSTTKYVIGWTHSESEKEHLEKRSKYNLGF